MKNLVLGIVCLVVGLGVAMIGVNQVTGHDVKCGDRVMHQDDSCRHVSGGSRSTNGYGEEKSEGRNVGIALLVIGPIVALGGVFYLQDAVRSRRRSRDRVQAPQPGPLPTGGSELGTALSRPPGAGGTRFTEPVELGCVLDADAAMKRMVPMLVVMAIVVWLAAAVAVGLMVPDPPAVSAIAATLIAVAVVVGMYLVRRQRLRQVYGQLQRLVVHSGGLRRFDPWVVIDIPWSGISRFERRNSSLPPASRVPIVNPAAAVTNAVTSQAHTVMAVGIVGAGTIAPLPGASRRMLQFQDKLYGSDLDGGRPYSSPNCLIFPAEFETNWTTGVVGAWLRHYRPDLSLPDHP